LIAASILRLFAERPLCERAGGPAKRRKGHVMPKRKSIALFVCTASALWSTGAFAASVVSQKVDLRELAMLDAGGARHVLTANSPQTGTVFVFLSS